MKRLASKFEPGALPLIIAVASALMLGLIGPLAHSSSAHAATPAKEWFVAQSGTANPGSGTSCAAPDAVGTDDTAIRGVLNTVTMDDTITICDGVYDITQTLIVDDSITIQGQSTIGSILDGGSSVQIMRLNDDDSTTTDPSEVFVLVQDLTFRNGNASDDGNCYLTSSCGGAIYVEDESDLTVRRVWFDNNRAKQGGAIFNIGETRIGGRIRVEDSTFSRNTATIDGGALGVAFSTQLTVVNSTFVENRALGRHGGAISESFGGGVVTTSTFVDNQGADGDAIRGRYIVTGSLFAGPETLKMCASGAAPGVTVDATSVSTGPGCGSAVIVTEDSLNLRGLGSWGGPTPTVWIGPGSAAENANTGTCPALDQRGATRSAAPCDAGAYERQGPTDEGTTGTLDYPGSLLADDTVIPTSSPTPSPPVVGRSIGYMSLSADVCAVDDSNGEVTPTADGACEIQWYLAPTITLDGAAADDSLTITKQAQLPLETQAPVNLVVGSTTTLATTGGTTGQTVVYSASPAGVCTVAGDQLSIVGPGTCTVSATMPGDSIHLPVNAPDVNIVASSSAPPATPARPASPPLSVTAEVVDSTALVTWREPASQGDFAITHYQVLSQPSGGWCLVTASARSCQVEGLTDGQTYEFQARALTGAGWSGWSELSNPITVPGGPDISIVTSGSRESRRVEVTGVVSGLDAGAVLRPWVRLRGQKQFTQGRARIVVDESGEFTWSRRARRVVQVYVATPDAQATSNIVHLRTGSGRP